MSAPTTSTTAGQEYTEGAAPMQDRDTRITALAETLHAQKQTANGKKAPGDRQTDRQLWKDAYREARSEIRREDAKAKTKEITRAAATSAAGQGKSLLHRNRRQLAPWMLAAPYAATGTAAGVAAEQAAANPLAISALVAGASVGGSLLAWRKKVADRVPSRFRQKATAGMGLCCGWATAAPLVDSPAGMALSLVVGTGLMGASWWREHDHGIPLPADENETAGEDSGETPNPAAETERQHRVRAVIESWQSKVAPSGKAVPGSTIEYIGSTEAVDRYRITLDDSGHVTRKQFDGLTERIGMALGIMEDRLSFEQSNHPAQVILKHLHTDPVFHYDGPIVLCNGEPIQSRWDIPEGADVDIVFGTYLDGGHASYRVIEQGSVNSAFILGGMGSGKTKTAEIIAIGLRMLGCYILWIDGQSGASSPLLNEHANQTFGFNMDDREDDSGVREFTAAVSAFAKKRNQDLQNHPELGGEYTYDPHRPPFIGMMDEAHEVFQTKHPKGKTYAHRLDSFGVQLRKLGGAFIALSQDYDKTDTFGGSSRLRDSLVVSGNLIAMRQTDKSRIGMLPTGCPRLDTVPDRGYGYLPLRSRPDGLWLTLNVGKTRAEALDTLTGWMQHYEPGVLEFDLDGEVADTASPEDQPGADSTLSASGGGAAVVHFPGSAPAASGPDAADPAVAGLSNTEQECLALVQGEPQTRSTLARARGVSGPAAGKVLDRLAKKQLVVKMEDGRYMAKV